MTKRTFNGTVLIKTENGWESEDGRFTVEKYDNWNWLLTDTKRWKARQGRFHRIVTEQVTVNYLNTLTDAADGISRRAASEDNEWVGYPSPEEAVQAYKDKQNQEAEEREQSRLAWLEKTEHLKAFGTDPAFAALLEKHSLNPEDLLSWNLKDFIIPAVEDR